MTSQTRGLPIACPSRGSLQRARQPFECGVERLVALGEAEAHHGTDRVGGIECGNRNCRDPVLDNQTLAEAHVVFVKTEWRKIDVDEVRALGVEHWKAERAQAADEAVATALEIAPH